jgi:hypothetical protein
VLCLLEMCCVQGLTHQVCWECWPLRALLLERFHRTAYGLNEPLNCAIRNFNNEIQRFDFCVSREGFHKLFSRPWPLNDIIFVVFIVIFFLYEFVSAMAFFLFLFVEKMNDNLL